MAIINELSGNRIADEKGNATDEMASWLKRAFILFTSVQESGITANRPTKLMWVGRRYYDTTIGKPVYASAISGVTITWKDATGAVV